ncbi:MAG: hypothetical protein RL196_184 [Actinomycetota bacterium]|jgi:hypothetical protein
MVSIRKISFAKGAVTGLAVGSALGLALASVVLPGISRPNSSESASQTTETKAGNYSFASPVFAQMTEQLTQTLNSYENFAGLRLDDKSGVVVYFKGQMPERAKAEVHKLFGEIPLKIEGAAFTHSELANAKFEALKLIDTLLKHKKIDSAITDFAVDFSGVEVSINVIDKNQASAVKAQIEGFNGLPIHVVATDDILVL